ncbi:hypothetical protein V8E54_010345 [Elaphomyces granulatus]
MPAHSRMQVPHSQLPTIQTRKALLLLDLQNDFVRTSGHLPVSNVANFIDLIPGLVQSFRRSGDIVWVRSQYESSCLLIDPDTGSERIVLAAGSLDSKKRTKSSIRVRKRDAATDNVRTRGENTDADKVGVADAEIAEEESNEVDPEAFLSGPDPSCRPQTPGVQFPAPIVAAVDHEVDTQIIKSDYSALQSPGLVLSLRSRFVTELYLCGTLSNISVYATALDAVRQGFSVTLIEDCLGFRSFARHEEAMRRMADIMGANGISTKELLEEQDWEETDDIAHASPRIDDSSDMPGVTPAGLDGVLDYLAVGLVTAGDDGNDENEGDERDDPNKGHKVQVEREVQMDAEQKQGQKNEDDGEEERRADERNSAAIPRRSVPAERRRTRMRRPRRPEAPAETNSAPKLKPAKTTKPTQPGIRGPGDRIGEGDSRIQYNLDLPSEAFTRIRDEVRWQKMYHLSGPVPRLVAVQGEIRPDGVIPIYRHPADESPQLQSYTSTVQLVRTAVEQALGHPLNHVLIQRYRDGQDRISEHADKTLDIVRGSFIANVSLGAQRTMVLRTKVTAVDTAEDDSAGRPTQRVPMPHESLFVLGEHTNRRWLHSIRPDRRPDSAKAPEERAFGGERISLTFRHIGTFIQPSTTVIWGQGAVAKHPNQARPVIHGDAAETERLIRAFGRENHDPNFDWDAIYGGGFDVVNFEIPSIVTLVLSDDDIADLRVRLALAENGLRHEVVSDPPTPTAPKRAAECERPIYLSPDGNITVTGDIQILSYLGQSSDQQRPGVDRLPGGSRLEAIEELTALWRRSRQDGYEETFRALAYWDQMLQGKNYLNGSVFGIDDCALWPVLRAIVREKSSESLAEWPSLNTYYYRVEKRGCVRVVLEEI